MNNLRNRPVTAESRQVEPNELTRSTIQAALKSVSDIMRRSNSAGAMQYVPEISWLLFLRILDEREELLGLHPARAEAIPPPYRWRDWATPPQSTLFAGDSSYFPGWKRAQLLRCGPGEVLSFVRESLLPHLRALGSSAEAGEVALVVSAVLRTVDRPRLTDESDFLAVLDRLDSIRENRIDTRHVFPISEVYEGLLLKMGEKASDGGQFFTPREVIRLMVRIVDPAPHETIYDPCCGTGGFLAESFEYIKRRFDKTAITAEYYGREKDNAIYPITLANLLLHGIRRPRIWNGNALTGVAIDSSLFPETEALAGYDVILTNPPFGGKESPETQHQFEFPTGSTQILFLQHVLRSLKPGGRCGIVVDEGVLFRTAERGFLQTKRKLLAECNLYCIVSLPVGAFSSAGATVKTNLLFFKKGEPTENIWYYDLSERVVGRKTPLTLEDFGEFFRLYPGRENSPRSWTRTARELAEGGYDLKATNPNSANISETHSLMALLDDLDAAARDMASHIRQLRHPGIG